MKHLAAIAFAVAIAFSWHCDAKGSRGNSSSASHSHGHSSRAAPGVQRNSHGKIARSARARGEFKKSHPCPSTWHAEARRTSLRVVKLAGTSLAAKRFIGSEESAGDVARHTKRLR